MVGVIPRGFGYIVPIQYPRCGGCLPRDGIPITHTDTYSCLEMLGWGGSLTKRSHAKPQQRQGAASQQPGSSQGTARNQPRRSGNSQGGQGAAREQQRSSQGAAKEQPAGRPKSSQADLEQPRNRPTSHLQRIYSLSTAYLQFILQLIYSVS